MRIYKNPADVLPEDESVLGQAIFEHERARIVLFECAATGRADDWSAIDAFLDQHGAGRH